MTLDREEVLKRLGAVGYVADPQLAAAIVLMQQLSRPLLIEGEAGVGKTEVAKALAEVLETPLIRLQCYEGLDANAAVYEWDYQRQLLAIKIWESEERTAEEKERHIFDEDFLLKRPLLKAISMDRPPVLLVDEIEDLDQARLLDDEQSGFVVRSVRDVEAVLEVAGYPRRGEGLDAPSPG